jgi:hypothetical protein
MSADATGYTDERPEIESPRHRPDGSPLPESWWDTQDEPATGDDPLLEAPLDETDAILWI